MKLALTLTLIIATSTLIGGCTPNTSRSYQSSGPSYEEMQAAAHRVCSQRAKRETEGQFEGGFSAGLAMSNFIYDYVKICVAQKGYRYEPRLVYAL